MFKEKLSKAIQLYIKRYREYYDGKKAKEEMEEDLGSHSNITRLNIGAYNIVREDVQE